MSDPSHSPPASLSPPATATTSGDSRQARPGPSAAPDWMNTADDANGHMATDGIQQQPGEVVARSRAKRMEEYMRAYARGEVGKDNSSTDPNHAPAQQQERAATTEDESMQPIPSRDQHPTAPSPQPEPAAPLLNEEEARSYQLFLAAAQHRTLQRHDLATRDAIWHESLARSRARLGEVNAEKLMLEHKIVEMERARQAYQRERRVEISEEQDFQEGRRWEEWLRVRRGIEVGGNAGGDGGQGGQGDRMDEDGGVDI